MQLYFQAIVAILQFVNSSYSFASNFVLIGFLFGSILFAFGLVLLVYVATWLTDDEIKNLPYREGR